MGISCRHEDNLLVLDCTGSFTHQEAAQALQDAIETAAESGSWSLLIHDPDSHYLPPAEDVPAVAQALANFVPQIKPQVALYVATDLKFGIGRMISAHGEAAGLNLRVFRDEQKARQWLRQF